MLGNIAMRHELANFTNPNAPLANLRASKMHECRDRHMFVRLFWNES